MKPQWLEIAEKEIGVKEMLGGENQRIIEYHSSTTLKAIEDEVPWCSSFVNWCFQQCGMAGTGSALASSWLKWGTKLDEPKIGCVVVVKRKGSKSDKSTGSTTGYHVGFYVGRTPESISILGGNQADSVKVSSFTLSKYKNFYIWPLLRDDIV